ncbi:SPOR domain-containing protein [Roseovarius ramblicola]|uniref:SPOR domain-containing protein n=1 Tax=Roseovarius ramblicola TaxID=2022336 RepID=A0ABV5I3G0_9RHOB
MTPGKRSGPEALGRLLSAALGLVLLAGCDESGNFALLQPEGGEQAATAEAGTRSTRLVERDVEAPEVFQATAMGLWDGRPSLGGVWVAHPDAEAPERVIIRNTATGKFVIGALFRRQREVPGPAFQVSSDAASALGLLAGAPQQLNVTALRREEAPAEPAGEEAGDDAAAGQGAAPAPGIEASDLDPVAGAEAAIGAAEEEAAAAAAGRAREPSGTRPERPASSLARPFVQVGIFSIEKNARNSATALRQAGMVPTVFDQTSQGKRFWRVVVGPIRTAAERTIVLEKIKGIGFADAYPVTN